MITNTVANFNDIFGFCMVMHTSTSARHTSVDESFLVVIFVCGTLSRTILSGVLPPSLHVALTKEEVVSIVVASATNNLKGGLFSLAQCSGESSGDSIAGYR